MNVLSRQRVQSDDELNETNSLELRQVRVSLSSSKEDGPDRNSGRTIDEQLDVYQSYYEMNARTLGIDHPSTLASLHELALLYHKLGQFAKASEELDTCYQKQVAKLGADDIQTLDTLNDRGLNLIALGRREEGLKLLLDCMERRKKVLGESHADSLSSMTNLALYYMDCDLYEDALGYLTDFFDTIADPVCDQEHNEKLYPLRVINWMRLATVYLKLEKYALAEAAYLQVYQFSRSVYGTDHSETQRIREALGHFYALIKNFEKAEEYFLGCLEHYTKQRARGHPEAVAVMGALGKLYFQQQLYGEADPLLGECWEQRRRENSQSQAALESLRDLALNRKMQGKVDEAVPLFVTLLEGLRVVYGARHAETLLCMTELAILYRFQHQYERALPLYEECLASTTQLYGPAHGKTLLCMNNLANLYSDMKRFKEAEALYLSCVEHSTAEHGTAVHPKVLQYRNNLALLYIDQGDARRGCEMLQ
ncbi:unnamed protein product, partial [Sphagnum compactum]